MVYIVTKHLKESKNLRIALKKIYGIGNPYSKYLCKKLGLSLFAYVRDLDYEMIKMLSKYIKLEGVVDKELKNIVYRDIKLKIKLKSYQGLRHLQGLPVNGQNTKNNSKTAKYLLRQKRYAS